MRAWLSAWFSTWCRHFEVKQWNRELFNCTFGRLKTKCALIWSKVSTSKHILETWELHSQRSKQPQTEDVYLSSGQDAVKNMKNQEFPLEMLEFPPDSSCTLKCHKKTWNLRPLHCKRKPRPAPTSSKAKNRFETKLIQDAPPQAHFVRTVVCQIFVSVRFYLSVCFESCFQWKKGHIYKMKPQKQNLWWCLIAAMTQSLTFQVPMRSPTVT